jgi:hypothetical protein
MFGYVHEQAGLQACDRGLTAGVIRQAHAGGLPFW